MLWVVVSCHVAQYRSALHNSEPAVVMVDEDWDPVELQRDARGSCLNRAHIPPVRPQIGKPLLLLDVLPDIDILKDVVGFAIRLLDLL